MGQWAGTVAKVVSVCLSGQRAWIEWWATLPDLCAPVKRGLILAEQPFIWEGAEAL